MKKKVVIVYTLLIFILIFLSFRYVSILKVASINQWSLSFAYLLKVLVGFCFLYIYSSVYGKGTLSADAGAFMKESLVLKNVFHQSPIDYFKLLFGIGDQQYLLSNYLQETTHWDSGSQAIISDNRNILRVQSLIQFISFNNPTIHILISCFISTIALKHFFIAFKNRTLINESVLLFSLLLFPSVLFWTSGILKEPFMILGLSIIARSLFSIDTFQNKSFFGTLGVITLFAFKPYVLIAMLPAILYYFLFTYITRKKIFASLLLSLVLITSTIMLFNSQRNQVVHLLSRKQFDFKNVGKGGLHALAEENFYFFQQNQLGSLQIIGDSVLLLEKTNALLIQHGSMDKPTPIMLTPTGKKWFVYFKNVQSDGFIEVTMINDSFSQLIKNTPEAVINSLFRPFIWDKGSWLKYPAVLETIFLFSFLFYAINKPRNISKKETVTLISLAIFILTLSLIIGWVTPVLGAIVRYRIPAYLGIFIISILLINPYSSVKKRSK